jgi:DNA-directed RNA polymerase specialized sigma24 family protein
MERDRRTGKALRSALRRALLWHSMKLSTRQGELTSQFVRRLDAVIAVARASEHIKPYELAIFNARYDQGLSDYEIARIYHRKVKTVRNILYRVLGQVVAESEPQLIDALLNSFERANGLTN